MAGRRAVVVGGGIAGAAISKSLSARGVGVTLLEKSPQLCSGATWHAAGLVTRFAGSPKLKKLHTRSLEQLIELQEKYGINLHTPGSIRIIEKGDTDRVLEAQHHVNMARLYDHPDYPTRIIDSDEIASLHPLVDVSNVECGVWTPNDGDVDPTSLTNCVAQLARENGTVIKFRHEVTGIDRLPGGGFRVTAADAKAGGADVAFECDVLVNAAGLWSKHITELVDTDSAMSHPAFIIEHQYAITEEIPEVRQLSDAGGRLPVLRDLAGSSYIRQEGKGLLVGPYEANCRVRNYPDDRGTWKSQPPADWGMELFPDAMEEIEDNLVAAMGLVPALASVGISNCTNGPTIWTGDSLARCGRTHIPGYYDFNSLTYGIAQGLPLADYLTGVILDGEQPFDAVTDFDPLRYGAWANEQFTYEKVRDTYARNNRVAFPFEQRQAGRRHVPQLPLHAVMKEHGAVFAFSNSGVETPAYFAAPGADPYPAPPAEAGDGVDADFSAPDRHDTFTHHVWQAAAVDEANHVLNHVGLSHASFSKIRVAGEGARQFLDHITTNRISKLDGKCRLTYALTPAGRVLAEFTVTKEPTADGSDSYYVVGSRDYAAHDVAWLRQMLAAEWETTDEARGRISVTDISTDVDILHVAGPRAKELLAPLSPAIADLPFLTAAPTTIGGVPVNVFRVSFTGCAGYELHCAAEHAPVIHAALWSAPHAAELKLRHFGGYALNGLRVGVGFKIKGDLDYAHYTEAGIEPFISKKKAHFVGKLADGQTYDPTKRPALLRVDAPEGYEWGVPSDVPVTAPCGTICGYTTTGGYGVQCGHTVANSYMFTAQADLAAAGGLQVRLYGQDCPAAVLDAPPCPVTAK